MYVEVIEVDSNDLNQVCHVLPLVGKCLLYPLLRYYNYA